MLIFWFLGTQQSVLRLQDRNICRIGGGNGAREKVFSLRWH